MNIRTDLALENREMYHENNGGKGTEISGVSVKVDNHDEGIKITRIGILDKNGEEALGKPKGNYITLEVKGVIEGDEIQRETIKDSAARALASELKKLIKFHYKLKVLVIGLGNRSVTPDSLGPYTLSKVKVTRQMFLLFEADGDYEMSCVSGFAPGVMGDTGIETAELILQVKEMVNPDVIIAIDALAARNVERISTTIQINDTGIAPGAGMGNIRKQLNEETLGAKVVAIGVPTVIDSKTLILDAFKDHIKDVDSAEKFMENAGLDLIVTSTDIDQVIKDFSDIIAKGINITLHPGIYF